MALLPAFSQAAAAPASAGRTTISLDGQWQIGDSVSATEMPARFDHKGPVPGMANLAKPAFAGVDQFDSMELIANRIRQKRLPESARIQTAGIARQARNYFWYRREFTAPSARAHAMLKVNKAQFGTAVWLNGRKVGEYAGCFSAGVFDLKDAIRWGGRNELVIRIGAHPGVLPVTYPVGTDFEKLKWTPGIYDSVSVWFADDPLIESVQVAPRVESSEILVQTRLRNDATARDVTLDQFVEEWKSGKAAGEPAQLRVRLEAGETKTVTQTVKVANARLWSPEEPFLYRLRTRTGGDSAATRFGMREFRADSKTGRFHLNNKPYYLRGSNITLHRSFEDPACGALPWDDKWVRKLLVELPHKMHWNSFRFCIGPVPDRWLEIADEAGLLIQNEFFVWTGAPDWDRKYARHWDVPEMIRQYGDWMRDNWNHPSVAIWDANNESLDPVFGEKIIPAVRDLDLSRRPWENSYNPPVGPDDPVEHHPYLYHSTASSGAIKFRMSDLETMDPKLTGGHLPKEPHPIVINEYGWVWLNRDGTPTLLTEKLYPLVLGTNATATDRFAWNAYVLAAETEFWRAHRQAAGVLHFVYLTCSYPGVFTSDHFRDVRKLKLEPHFADYLGEAFKPLGVYVNFLHETLSAGQERSFKIMLVNDGPGAAQGDLTLSLVNERGRELAKTSQRFALAECGDATLELALRMPKAQSGRCVLKAVATPDGAGHDGSTVCRRWVTFVPGETSGAAK